MACIYALTAAEEPADRDKALALLSKAFQSGYGLTIAESDTDLDPIRDTREFRNILSAAKYIERQSQRQ